MISHMSYQGRYKLKSKILTFQELYMTFEDRKSLRYKIHKDGMKNEFHLED